ncbi:unnamed protein product [Peniophora sp. CBMAI 1063]|nr:unnamed protein product [Peniophora sp. CBMAI 1063]
MRAARAGPKPLTVATNELGPEPRPPLSKHALDFVKAKDKPTSRVKESDMPAWELTLGSTPILNAVPSFLASEDLNEPEGDAEPIIRYWEALLRKHGHHPYLLVRYAERLMVLSDAGHALVLLEECLEEMGALDAEVSPEFEASVEALREHLDTKTLHTDGNLPDPSLVQLWIPAAMLPMPSDALAPGGHAQVRSDWTQDFPKGSEALRYMRHLAVETHQVDRTFLITEESMKDIVQDGIAAHRIHVASGSKIQDPHVIDAILDDTLTASRHTSSYVPSSKIPPSSRLKRSAKYINA